MWGVVDTAAAHEATTLPALPEGRRVDTARLTAVQWARRHPCIVLLLQLIYLGFVAGIASLLAKPQRQQETAKGILQVLRSQPFPSFSDLRPPDDQSPFMLQLSDVHTADHVESWLYHVVRPLAQFGFPTVGSQLYSLEIQSLLKTPSTSIAVDAFSSFFKSKLDYLAVTSTSSADLTSLESLIYLPTNGGDLQAELDAFAARGAFGANCVNVVVTLTTFSASEDTWAETAFRFIGQGEVGRETTLYE